MLPRSARTVVWLALLPCACGPASSGGGPSVYQALASTTGLVKVEARRSVLSVHDRGPVKCVLALEGAARGLRLGESACALPDQDGDGRADFAVGAWNATGHLPLVSWGPGVPPAVDGFVLILRGDGRPLGWIREDDQHPCVGAGLAALDDVDGDGVHDWALHTLDVSLLALAAGVASKSAARVVSGSRRDLLHSVSGRLMPVARSVGDVDGDGCADLLTAVVEREPNTTHVELRSGRTRELLYGFEVSGRGCSSAVAVPDLDADGAPDFVISWRELHDGEDRRGAVDLRSGRSGRQLALHRAAERFEHFGHALLLVRDLDGDGLPELLVGTDNAHSSADFVGRVTCMSLATGRTLFALEGQYEYAQLGQSIVDVGDIDGDGASEVAVSAKRANGVDAFEGVTTLYSLSATGLTPLVEFPGAAAAALGDLDGDGRAEFACLSPDWPKSPEFRGRVLVFAVQR